MNSNRRRILLAAAAVGACPTVFGQAKWPSKPVTIAVPFTPGGATDALVRLVAKKFSELLGESFIVDNRGGAGGSIASELVARAAPDGHTVLWVTNGTMAINPAVIPNLKYDPLKDFAPVHLLLTQSPIMIVSPKRKFNSVTELVAYAKANPGALNYGSPGIGTSGHLGAALFARDAGIQMSHVPYRGSAQATQDLIAGRIDLMIDPIFIHLDAVKKGTYASLAIMGPARNPALPGVPSVVEVGYPHAFATSWNGLALPAGTDPRIVEALASAADVLLKDRTALSPFVSTGSVPQPEIKLDKFRAYIESEQKLWKQIVQKTGATVN